MKPWDDRHHVSGDGRAHNKPLPAPPKKITSLHGGPIKPRVDTCAPRSMHAPISKHAQRAPPRQSSSAPRLRDEANYRGSAAASSGGGGGGRNASRAQSKEAADADVPDPSTSTTQRLAAVEAELDAARDDLGSVQILAQRHQAAVLLRHHTAWWDHGDDEAKDPTAAVRFASEGSEAALGGHGLGAEAQSKAMPQQANNRSTGGGEGGGGFLLDLNVGNKKAEGDPSLALEVMDGYDDMDGHDDLCLDISSIHHDVQQRDHTRASGSYRLSESGTIRVDSFEIRRSGIVHAAGANQAERLRSSTDSRGGLHDSLVRLGVLGHGASSTVHKTLHVPTLRLVAEKIIPVFDDEKRRQMIRELRALADNLVPLTSLEWSNGPPAVGSPSCPFILSFHDAFVETQEGNISIIVEYMDGGSLQDIIDTGGCDCESVLANISFHVLQGLAFLHDKHQIHRDIKPANLLINHLGPPTLHCESCVPCISNSLLRPGQIKISDFGIVRDMENSISRADTFVGTFTYMSPERIGGQSYSYSADIWSFGLTVMTCALGRFPYTQTSGYWGLLNEMKEQPAPILPDTFTSEFQDFAALCLIKDPEKRPTARELLRHPFLAACSLDELETEVEDGDGSETARLELDEIIHVVREYYRSLWQRQVASGVSPTIPNFHRGKVRALAEQLGVGETLVRLRFAHLVRQLRSDAEVYWRDDQEK